MLAPPLDYLRRALKLSGEDHIEDAIAVVSEGIDLCEREPEYLSYLPRLTSNLGVFCRKLGRIDEALKAVRRALVHHPEDRSMLHFLADLLIEAGDIPAATAAAFELRRVCESNPETFTAEWVEALTLLEHRILPS